VGLFDHVVAAGRGDHLLVVDASQARELPDRGSIPPQLIGVDDLWDVILTQEASQERFRRFGVSVPLEEDVQHEPVSCPPAAKRPHGRCSGQDEPMSNAIDTRTDLVQMPPGTPSGFPVA
jgi:hypothetical protein